MRTWAHIVRRDYWPGRPGGNQDDVCVTDGIGSTGHGSGGQVKLVASPGREGFTVLRCRTVDTHAAGAPNRCQRPQLRPRLAAAANDANNLSEEHTSELQSP